MATVRNDDSPTDWHAWHQPYEDAASPLSQRLRIVQAAIADLLDERPDGALTIVSACAGQGRDLLGALAGRPDSGRVRTVLIERDPHNADFARNAADASGLTGVEVRIADAGAGSSYAGALPADLLLMVGVFGNISDADVQRTIEALPAMCAAGAAVVWTRSRRDPDLTPAIRHWFNDAGFTEAAFHAPEDVLFSVGVHRLNAAPTSALGPELGHLFHFLR